MKKKRYRNYTAKKYKLPKRILFFVICALVIFIFALILGNNLKNKMENADINREPIETYNDAETQAPSGISDGDARHPEACANVKAGYLTLNSTMETADVKAEIDKIKSNGFNAVSFICVSEGKLTYASKAAEDYSRLPSSESVIPFEVLTDALSYAKQKGLRASAVYTKGTDATLDALICGELVSVGFDEIILGGFENLLSESGGAITPCIEYLKQIRRGAEGCNISLSLSPAAYSYARNSYQIEKLFTYAEFMTIDMTELDAAAAEELCRNIAGSFSIYMLRPLIKGEPNDIIAVLSGNSIVSAQYVSPIPEAIPETTPDTEPAE